MSGKSIKLHFTEDQLERLKLLRHVTGLQSNEDLIVFALSILDWSASQVATGKEVGAVDDKEIVVFDAEEWERVRSPESRLWLSSKNPVVPNI